MTLKRVLKIGCGTVLTLVLGPWIVIAILMTLEKAKDEAKIRARKPTTLVEAVEWKYTTPEVVARFLDQGGDANQRVSVKSPTGGPDTPMALVRDAMRGGNVEVTRLLIKRGARPNEAGLWTCARLGRHPEMVRMLVEEGASLERQPDAEEYPGPDLLQAAAAGQEIWLIELLLKKGHDPQLVNAGGDGLLALALENEYGEQRLAAVKALLAAGAHVDPTRDDEVPPLYWAAYFGALAELDLLLAKGAKVDAPVPRSRVLNGAALPEGARLTALSIALERCHYEAAQRLLARGARRDVVATDTKPIAERVCWITTPVPEPERVRERERVRALLSR